jgi:DMSO reductase family type II enzyme chaperone
MVSGVEEGAGNAAVAWEDIDLYRFFAFVFGAPTRERFEWFHQPQLTNSLAGLWAQVGCQGGFPGVTPFTSYENYESTYIALFDVGLPQPPIPLLESAHYKALPAQQTALENTSFYEVLGLQTDRSRYPPDHLVTQLEFLSAVRYTRENTPQQENRESLARLERDFLERHLLNWVPTAEEKLRAAQTPVFPVLLTLLSAFLRQQQNR